MNNRNDKEQWKKYAGYYSVSTWGRVRNDQHGRILSGYKRNGYHTYTLRLPINGEMKSVNLRAHRMVAETFIGDIEGKEVHHVDANALNNHVDNLEITDQATNLAYKAYSAVIECPCCGCKINLAVSGAE